MVSAGETGDSLDFRENLLCLPPARLNFFSQSLCLIHTRSRPCTRALIVVKQTLPFAEPARMLFYDLALKIPISLKPLFRVTRLKLSTSRVFLHFSAQSFFLLLSDYGFFLHTGKHDGENAGLDFIIPPPTLCL